jgi:carbonic anhydrase
MGMQGLRGLFGGSRKAAGPIPAIQPRPQVPRPRPSAQPSPEQALAWLLEGNRRFVADGAAIAPHETSEINGLAKGQAPLAIVVGCSDSRVAPEILFHCRLGDLFVVRVAGATVDATALGSIEYAVHHLHCPLVVVLGHAGCGAVHAATQVVNENAEFDGALEDVVLPILPAVLRAKAAGANDLVNASVREHVHRVVRQVKRDATFAGQFGAAALKVVGGYYDLALGTVEVIA